MVVVVKNLPGNAIVLRDVSSTSGLGRSPGEENGNLLQYSCLENPMEEESGVLQSIKSVWDKEWDTTEVT